MRQHKVIKVRVVILRQLQNAKIKIGGAAAEVEDGIINVVVVLAVQKAVAFQSSYRIGGRLARALDHLKILHDLLIIKKGGRQGFQNSGAESLQHALADISFVHDGERQNVFEENMIGVEHVIYIRAEKIGVILQRVEFVLSNVEEGRQFFFGAVVVADSGFILKVAAPLLEILEEGSK